MVSNGKRGELDVILCRVHIILYYGNRETIIWRATAVHVSLHAILFFLTTFQPSLYHRVPRGALGKRVIIVAEKEKDCSAVCP